MSLPAIEVTGLSKRYVIEHESRHDTLRDTLHHTARKLWRRFRWGTGFQREEFWALRDVSFSVQPGEVVGIIGRNGAGKSTLLKILSRITEPTAGKVTLRGRVASLLEVGTGFHPDLTGRENIYLNGAILGMRRAEIRAKFDEIVAFAEVEKFLDTPVKRYSSGMYVRLAFAVAAHLEPEILIIDEVLAVGDVEFQKKCLGKIKTVARESGRTVLFVSHNLSVIQSICQRCLLFRQGRIVVDEKPGLAVERYLQNPGGDAWCLLEPSAKPCRFLRAGVRIDHAESSLPIITVDLKVFSDITRTSAFELILHDSSGQAVAIGQVGATGRLQFTPGNNELCVRFFAGHLALGRYSLSLRLLLPGIETIDEVLNALSFDFQAPPPAGLAYRPAHTWGGGSFLLKLRCKQT